MVQVICSKIYFITNITNVIRIHTFSFYNNRQKFTTDVIFTTKHIYCTKINTNPVVGPKSKILRSHSGTVPLKVSKIVFFVYVLIKYVSFVVKHVQFIVKLSLLQISLMLPKFTYFIFTDVFITIDTKFITKHKYFIKTVRSGT